MGGVLTGKGINASRKLLSGQTNFDNEISDLVTTASPKFMYRAVVVDVLFDPSAMLTEINEKYGNVIADSSLLSLAPRNSILARIVSNSADKRSQTPLLFFPLFSHTHEPIKPGEKVWVVFEDGERSFDLGYWLSRIVERRDIEDPNFTHGDRAFIDDQVPSTIERADLEKVTSTGPRFPNGSDTKEGYTLEGSADFEKIEKEAIANRISTREPVPRYSKRPNDWAAEGSNNSLLVLGEDRTGRTSKLISNKVVGRPDKDKLNGAAGMFDIVVGRGIGKDRKLPAPNVVPTLTAPPVISNVRKLLETDKDIRKENAQEGDPDFEFDAARVYGSMDTDVDGNFGKVLPKLNAKKDPENVDKGSVVVAKANHIRVIAREDGTIRIVKEGTPDNETGNGHAMIIIEKDGTIMIDGPHIIIGSGIEKENGAGVQLYLGRDATEPIVLGNILKSLLTEYTDGVKQNITDFCMQMTTFLTPLATSMGNLGLPIPGLSIPSGPNAPPLVLNQQGVIKLTTDITKTTQDFQSKLNTILSKVGKTK